MRCSNLIDKRIAVEIAAAAAENCIDVFEREYPDDLRPRQALQATKNWLADPDQASVEEIEKLEITVWRARDWHGRAAGAACACASAARAIRHPKTSAIAAIANECFANCVELPRDYGRRFLSELIRHSEFK